MGHGLTMAMLVITRGYQICPTKHFGVQDVQSNRVQLGFSRTKKLKDITSQKGNTNHGLTMVYGRYSYS